MEHVRSRWPRSPARWSVLCKQWNEAHPQDCRHPESLRISYFRARKDLLVSRSWGSDTSRKLIWVAMMPFFREWPETWWRSRPEIAPVEFFGSLLGGAGPPPMELPPLAQEAEHWSNERQRARQDYLKAIGASSVHLDLWGPFARLARAGAEEAMHQVELARLGPPAAASPSALAHLAASTSQPDLAAEQAHAVGPGSGPPHQGQEHDLTPATRPLSRAKGASHRPRRTCRRSRSGAAEGPGSRPAGA